MKPDLRIGDAGELTWTVDPTMTITLGGVPQATVFSTPSMIMLMEQSAREALRPFLEDGEESIGVEVRVEHTGASADRTAANARTKIGDVSASGGADRGPSPTISASPATRLLHARI